MSRDWNLRPAPQFNNRVSLLVTRDVQMSATNARACRQPDECRYLALPGVLSFLLEPKFAT